MGTGATLPNNIPACRSEFFSKQIWVKKIGVQKNIWVKNMLAQKKIWCCKNFGSKKFGPIKF